MKYLLIKYNTNIKYTEKYIYKVNCAYIITTKIFVPIPGHYWDPWSLIQGPVQLCWVVPKGG